MNNITAVVPTRKGSERVKSKNTRSFAGKSLLEYKLETLIKLHKFDYIKDIVVNSDCEESRKISESYDIPFIERDPYLATSEAPITDYWSEVLLNTKTEHSMLCQCSSPLISYNTYVDAIQKYNGVSMIGSELIKDFIWKNGESLNYEWPNHPRSQDLSSDYWKLNFGIVIIRKEEILEYNNIKTPNTQLYSIPENENLDIDNLLEFKLAEMLINE
jgi:CMP-N-acetylneuraminic acid synthetase|tara:strand:- start:3698 stop:4345 length:648 start_codon:yes stop_codon:yes gene_type:complete